MTHDIEVEVEVEEASCPMEDLFYVGEDEADQVLQQPQTATIVHTAPITINNNETNNNFIINHGDSYTSTVQQTTRFSTIHFKQQQQLQYPVRWNITGRKTEQILQQLDQGNFSQMAISDDSRGIPNSFKFESDSMKIEDAFKNQRPTSSGLGIQEIFGSRNYRNFTYSEQRLSLQLLHDPRSDQETTNSGLQNDQQLHSVQSLQDGGSADSSGSNREKRLYLQNRLERCLCRGSVTSELTQISNFSSSRQSLSIQNFSFRNECQSSGIQQNYALCYRTVKEREHTYDLLLGRYMLTGEIQRRNEGYQQESDRTFAEFGFHHQFTEECIDTVRNSTVLRIPIQHKKNVDYCTPGKNFQTSQKGKD